MRAGSSPDGEQSLFCSDAASGFLRLRVSRTHAHGPTLTGVACFLVFSPRIFKEKRDCLQSSLSRILHRKELTLGKFLRMFTRKFSNIDFFLKILPLKDDELAMSEM